MLNHSFVAACSGNEPIDASESDIFGSLTVISIVNGEGGSVGFEEF